jgi:hypothetical protein
MEHKDAANWIHTTAPKLAESEAVGIDLFAEDGQTAIYLRFSDNTRWPARTVNMEDLDHASEIIESWEKRGPVNDYRPIFHPYADWENNPEGCIYLGSEANPHTRKYKYDYWLVKTGPDADDWSPTARHGTDDPDYGSCPLCVAWYDYTRIDSTKDFIFGMERARQLGLYYLATKKKPIIPNVATVSLNMAWAASKK